MKVAIVDNLPDGGAKRVVFEQIKFLSKKHQVLYFTNQHRSFFQFKKYADKIFRFDLDLSKTRGWQRPLREWELLVQLRSEYRKMAEKMNQSTIDAVIVHPCKHTQAPDILRFLNKPSFYYIHEPLRIVYEPELHHIKVKGLKQYYEQIRRRLIKKIDKTNLLKADKLLVNSKFTARNIWQFYERKAEVIYPGVDSQVFRPEIKAMRKYFLFIGQKVEINGYRLLVKTLRQIDGQIEVKYLEFGERGFQLSEKSLISHYQKAIAVLCLGRNEPFGLTAIEAMACGVAVIAVNEAGYKETVIDQQTGLMISRKVGKLAKAMSLLQKNEKMRSKLGKQGRERVIKNFNWQDHGIRLEKSLQSSLS